MPLQIEDSLSVLKEKILERNEYYIVKVWCKQEHRINFLVINCAYYYVWLRDREQKHTYVRNMSNTPKRGLKQRTTTKRKIIKDLIALSLKPRVDNLVQEDQTKTGLISRIKWLLSMAIL